MWGRYLGSGFHLSSAKDKMGLFPWWDKGSGTLMGEVLYCHLTNKVFLHTSFS